MRYIKIVIMVMLLCAISYGDHLGKYKADDNVYLPLIYYYGVTDSLIDCSAMDTFIVFMSFEGSGYDSAGTGSPCSYDVFDDKPYFLFPVNSSNAGDSIGHYVAQGTIRLTGITEDMPFSHTWEVTTGGYDSTYAKGTFDPAVDSITSGVRANVLVMNDNVIVHTTLAAGALKEGVFGTDAITAAALKADAVTKIQAGLALEASLFDPASDKVTLVDSSAGDISYVANNAADYQSDGDTNQVNISDFDDTTWILAQEFAKESTVEGIQLTGTNISTVANGRVLTDGTETNTYAATQVHDDVYYEVAEGGTGTNLNINYYLRFDIGEDTKPVSATYHGRLDEGSAPSGQDEMDVFVYDWDLTSWTHVSPALDGDIVGVFNSSSSDDQTYQVSLIDPDFVGTGDSVGVVWLAFSNYDPDGAASSNLKENTELYLDFVFLEYQSILSAASVYTYFIEDDNEWPFRTDSTWINTKFVAYMDSMGDTNWFNTKFIATIDSIGDTSWTNTKFIATIDSLADTTWIKAQGYSTLIASDNIGINWGNITNQNTSVNLSATTTDDVGDVTGNVAGNVTGNVGGDVVGDVQGNVDGSVASVGSGGITATSMAENSINYAAFAATEPTSWWNQGGKTGYELSTGNIDAIVDSVWDEDTTGHNVANSYSEMLEDTLVYQGSGSSLTAGEIADAVWDEDSTGHNTANSYSVMLKDTLSYQGSVAATKNDSLEIRRWVWYALRNSYSDSAGTMGDTTQWFDIDDDSVNVYGGYIDSAIQAGTATVDTAAVARSVWDNDVVALANRTTTVDTASIARSVFDADVVGLSDRTVNIKEINGEATSPVNLSTFFDNGDPWDDFLNMYDGTGYNGGTIRFGVLVESLLVAVADSEVFADDYWDAITNQAGGSSNWSNAQRDSIIAMTDSLVSLLRTGGFNGAITFKGMFGDSIRIINANGDAVMYQSTVGSVGASGLRLKGSGFAPGLFAEGDSSANTAGATFQGFGVGEGINIYGGTTSTATALVIQNTSSKLEVIEIKDVGNNRGNIYGNIDGYVTARDTNAVGDSLIDYSTIEAFVTGRAVIGDTNDTDSDIADIKTETDKLTFAPGDTLLSVNVRHISDSEAAADSSENTVLGTLDDYGDYQGSAAGLDSTAVYGASLAALMTDSATVVPVGDDSSFALAVVRSGGGGSGTIDPSDPIFDTLTAIHEDVEALSLSGGGTEPETLVIAYDIGSPAPIEGAKITIRDITGSTVKVDGLLTDVNGRRILELDADSFYVAVTHNNYDQVIDTLVVASGGGTDTLFMTPFDPGSPVDTTKCRVWGYAKYGDNTPIEKAFIEAQIPESYWPVRISGTGTAIMARDKTDETDTLGYWFLDLVPQAILNDTSSYWGIKCTKLGNEIFYIKAIVPESTSIRYDLMETR